MYVFMAGSVRKGSTKMCPSNNRKITLFLLHSPPHPFTHTHTHTHKRTRRSTMNSNIFQINNFYRGKRYYYDNNYVISNRIWDVEN